VIVEDKQLSLAIGKKGQNVRLAAKLTGWKIDIKSEEEKRREVEKQLGALEIGEPSAESEGEGEAGAEGDAAAQAAESGASDEMNAESASVAADADEDTAAAASGDEQMPEAGEPAGEAKTEGQ
jgi:N utilization substance protein A